MIHELGKLAAAEEVTNNGGERFGIYQFLRSHGVDPLVEKSHAFLHQPLCASKTHPALIGEQFTHGPYSAAPQMINIIQSAFTLFQT